MPAFRWPSLRRPFDWLFILTCIVLAGFVLVPEIWGAGKRQDYLLWYWAGQQVLEGGPLYERKLQSTMDFIYPPVTAILLALPSAFGKLPFYIGLTLLNVAAWWIAAQLSQIMTGSNRTASPWVEAVPSFIVLAFVFDQFQLGQPNLVLLMLMLLGFWMMQRGWPFAGGGLFALATAIKAFPIAVLPYLVWRRRWKTLSGMLAGLVLLLVVLPAPIRGFDRNINELSTWYQAMVGSSSEEGFGQRNGQNWSWVNQSIIAVTHRLLRPVEYLSDPAPQYVNVANLSYRAANVVLLVVVGCLGLAFLAAMRPRSQLTPRFEADEIAILFCLMTIASPLARHYYFVWLLFPFTVLSHRAAFDPRPHIRRATWIVIGIVVALMALALPFFPKAWQALGNLLVATLLLAAAIGWHMRNPPKLEPEPAMSTAPE
jgi:hypothetical protein